MVEFETGEGEIRLNSLRFNFSELTGAVGDSITVLPIVVALSALTEVSLAYILIGFGVFQIVWGVYYGLPISVEPMKALAALGIAGTLTYSELAAAGLVAGVLLLFAGKAGLIGRVESYISLPVVRGVQLGVALILLRTGFDLSVGEPRVAALGVVVAGAMVALGYRESSTFAVLGVGAVISVATSGVPHPQLPALPSLVEFDLTSAALGGVAAQMGMTVGNAAIATSVLISDFFDSEVSGDELSVSMGVMNILAAPLGAIPMCHGSGGLAGKYTFGARTGGANVFLGIFYFVVALFASSGTVTAFPMAVLGVLLAMIALRLSLSAFESDDILFTVGVGVLGLVVNIGAALVIGALAYSIRRHIPFRQRLPW